MNKECLESVKKKNHSDSYNPSACCGDDCFRYGWDETPCWGDVEVIDEIYDGEDSWYWIHACQGHIRMWYEHADYDNKYRPEPDK